MQYRAHEQLSGFQYSNHTHKVIESKLRQGRIQGEGAGGAHPPALR